MRLRPTIAIVALLGVFGVSGLALASDGGGGDDYTVKLVVPSAAQLLEGSPVWVDGLKAGSVESLEVRNGKAVIEARLDEDYAPLHDGTTSRVEWNSVVGERMLTLYPGPEANAKIPDGGMFETESRQIELDQILDSVDKPTRKHLVSLIGRLRETTQGREQDLQSILKSAGPAVDSLGQVLQAIGRDGPAIRDLVTQLDKMTSVASRHRRDVEGTVQNLSKLTGTVAAHEGNLSEVLKQLPTTLKSARRTLDRVPAAGAATTPLLNDLEPATERLGPVSKNLRGAMHDLRPTVATLRPMLSDAQELLGTTPDMLDTSHQVLPPVQSAVESYQPALSFLRPYTPELMGWLHNFGQSFSGYDSQGHFWATTLAPGVNALNESVIQPPTSYTNDKPDPGSVVGQSWTDATGSEMQ